ncbi:MAG: DUF2147 domain-containing protein [Rhodobacter sp.]|nr:DUF2147 domain-containing protein [Rhodobacter sp.]
MKRFLIVCAAIGVMADAAQAAPLLGVWQTEPDGKNQTGHVQITPCGAALCGTVVSAYDASGKQITTASVGKRVIRDIRQTGENTFGGGQIYVPLMRAEFPLEIRVSGNHMNLKACNSAGLCRTQKWARVK